MSCLFDVKFRYPLPQRVRAHPRSGGGGAVNYITQYGASMSEARAPMIALAKRMSMLYVARFAKSSEEGCGNADTTVYVARKIS